MRILNRSGLVCVLLSAAACSAPATSGTDAPKTAVAADSVVPVSARAKTQGSSGPTLDLGDTNPTDVVSVSVIFKAQPAAQLEAFVESTQDPWSPQYHHFLSVNQFARAFAPSSAAIARVSAYLGSFGITAGPALADNLVLKATGTVAAFTQAFTFQMHDYQNGSGRFHRPTTAPCIPGSLSDVMLVVAGFSSQPAFTPKFRSASSLGPIAAPATPLPAQGNTATNTPGAYTVGDFANRYDVNPLYKAGIDGTGSTIGIATMAGFYPADAYNYWSSIGLDVSQTRIQQIHVDEGAPISSQQGSIETALDVEQSGGLAPGANMVVYDAPNTDGGFLDLFYNAASDNLVDSLSVSWGGAEVFYDAALSGVDFTSELVAFHQVFLEGAAQGISMFASSGDSGAYDYAENGIAGLSNELAVDAPASDPAITAAGGTTTPETLNGNFFGGPTTTNDFVVTQEQAWGWDAFQNWLNANDVAPLGDTWSFFSSGTGGGVSIQWPVPWYQQGFPGIQRSQPGQVITYATTGDDGGTTTQTLFTMPAHYAGRNVPDISADADPFSGYSIYSTPDGGWNYYYGGTSFVGPQMNGVTALVRQRVHGRVGLLNPMLYRFAQSRSRAIVDVTGGDNWFYDGIRGYEPATGLGVLDVNAFANAVAND